MFCLYISNLCMIHRGALSGSPRSLSTSRGARRRGAPSPRTNRSPRRVRVNVGTPYLHSPGNSATLGTSTAPRTGAATAAAAPGRSGAAGTDRSTGRVVVVVVPFSGCAAPSLHPCRRCGVSERSAAIEEGERRQRRRRARRRRRRRRVQRLPYGCQSASGLWGGGALRGGFWINPGCGQGYVIPLFGQDGP